MIGLDVDCFAIIKAPVSMGKPLFKVGVEKTVSGVMYGLLDGVAGELGKSFWIGSSIAGFYAAQWIIFYKNFIDDDDTPIPEQYFIQG